MLASRRCYAFKGLLSAAECRYALPSRNSILCAWTEAPQPQACSLGVGRSGYEVDPHVLVGDHDAGHDLPQQRPALLEGQ